MALGARRDPDELLRQVTEEEKREHRGKLTIFFGAAPGVGKTYAMLEAARLEKDGGRDVVIGIVETHGRYDTAGLVIGLELLPRRKEQHRGVAVEEFDLDKALERKPSLILVDELAHTNAPGSRRIGNPSAVGRESLRNPSYAKWGRPVSLEGRTRVSRADRRGSGGEGASLPPMASALTERRRKHQATRS